ncbi:winged helix-turn-helix domain-containing protein [Thermococcus sp.]|uniref:ArsR/SmtB family transcription factor n=1 Tax=Thermococcus sp. TaxID=35749 RepID=UPI0034201FA2
MGWLDFETMDIHDERAKELAQILTNEKALAILHLLEGRELSISEISKELNLPISTVSYHIDKLNERGVNEPHHGNITWTGHFSVRGNVSGGILHPLEKILKKGF